ncbi:TonB-dependent receptor [Dysgonomonas sp. 521]|uniref:SusC/RagA family TonB-linked outer membrane protein n=1 Tax=Dysgonomonas sp. 521 TaxID=2302932 RepID=UPI0013D5B38F|nr:TonB-dependent receptor [Dysgonomonas sp. 521]NDV95901.1 TonB-dependent receptor [Dysgonomonas sp. 521]
MQKTIKKILSLICISLFLLCGQNVYAQQREIRGTVTDSQGEPLIGVTIAVKGTTKATMTDIDGTYTLSVGNDVKTLTATFVGMKPSEKTITGNVLDFVMEDLASELEEVVVIGYGTMKRKDLTGSVSSIKGDVVQAVPVSNVAEAITGKLAGVQITTTEGSPDAEMKIRVRGGGSITGDNTPLFIVDGFPMESISDIAPTDIESIDVLKDASSTAIYGSRGANGVILITTKSGKEGKLSVSYNAYYSWKKNTKTLDVLSPKDYASWQYELAGLIKSSDMSSYTDYFGNYQDMDLYDNVAANDWQDITFGRTGHTFNHNLSITGGSEKIRYAFSYSHMNDKAIMVGSSFKRDNFSLKLNTNPVKNVSIDYSIRYSDTDINGDGTNNTSSTYDTDKRLKYSVIYTPIPLSNLTSDAGSSDDDLGNLYHPLTSTTDNARKRQRKSLNMTGSVGWEIFDNFRVKAELGLDDYRNNDNRYWGLTTYYIKNVPTSANQGKPAIQLANTSRQSFRSTNTVNYDFKKLLGKDHHLAVMAGHEYIITKVNTQTNIVHGFPTSFTAEDAWKYSTEGTPFSVNNYYQPDDKLLSYFGRVNYDYQSKYLFSATFRADGSSKFGEGNKWGYFPSAALAWRVSSEPFMAGTKGWLEDLKLRLSYGTAGNNNIPSGQIAQTYASSSTSWINGFGNYWAPSKYMANPDLKWETTVTRNVGLDFTFLGGKLSGTVEAYLNTTKDLLIEFPVSGTGYDYQYRNMGKTQNKGIEATINVVAIDKKDYGLTFSANIGFNKNTIKSLGIMNDFGSYTYWASSEIGNDFWVSKGGSVGKIYGYRADGRYEVSDFDGYDEAKGWLINGESYSSEVGKVRPGTMKLKDLNGDGKITADDREIIGDANPLHTGGFTINGRLYGFDLSANFNWSYGNDIYNANKIEFTQTGKYQYRNMTSEMASGKRWTNLRADGTISNDAAELAAMNANTTMWSPYTGKMIFSDWAVEDGSFLRLNTLTLGYTLPGSLTSKAKLQNVRFYVTGYNLFCITGYSGYDPEVSTMRRTNLTPGVDYSAYPKSRQFVVGLNLNF